MTPRLEYVDRAVVTFDDQSYRWVDVKRFLLSQSADDSPLAAVQALISQPSYRDPYNSPDSETEEPLHGPYQLECISVDSFEAVSRERARETLDTFLNLDGGTTAETDGRLAAKVFPLLDRASAAYRLRDLGAGARHEYGWILMDFTELVLLDAATGELHLVVAAID